MAFDFGDEVFRLSADALLDLGRQFLVGKIDGRFEMGEDAGQPVPGSAKRVRRATRAGGRPPANADTANAGAGPERRRMAMAARPAAVAGAKIVSEVVAPAFSASVAADRVGASAG